jgi:phosphatidate phosphatase LPIN
MTPESSTGSSISDKHDDLPTYHTYLRATSEPPPETDKQQKIDSSPDTLPSINLPMREYSWEWGAFPQPSPMTTGFSKGIRLESGLADGKDMNASWNGTETRPAKGRPRLLSSAGESEAGGKDARTHRSKSVPPDLEGSPTMKRREIPTFHPYANERSGDEDEDQQDHYGAGGRLTCTRTDPTLFTVRIEGQKVSFELSLVDFDTDSDNVSRELWHRRRRSIDDAGRLFDGRSEVEAARIFDQGKVTYLRFMEDENILKDERLVIRWAGDQ